MDLIKYGDAMFSMYFFFQCLLINFFFIFWQFFVNKKMLLKKHPQKKMGPHCTTPLVEFCEIDGLAKVHKKI
jgi:hypothetical protein